MPTADTADTAFSSEFNPLFQFNTNGSTQNGSTQNEISNAFSFENPNSGDPHKGKISGQRRRENRNRIKTSNYVRKSLHGDGVVKHDTFRTDVNHAFGSLLVQMYKTEIEKLVVECNKKFNGDAIMFIGGSHALRKHMQSLTECTSIDTSYTFDEGVGNVFNDLCGKGNSSDIDVTVMGKKPVTCDSFSDCFKDGIVRIVSSEIRELRRRMHNDMIDSRDDFITEGMNRMRTISDAYYSTELDLANSSHMHLERGHASNGEDDAPMTVYRRPKADSRLLCENMPYIGKNVSDTSYPAGSCFPFRDSFNPLIEFPVDTQNISFNLLRLGLLVKVNTDHFQDRAKTSRTFPVNFVDVSFIKHADYRYATDGTLSDQAMHALTSDVNGVPCTKYSVLIDNFKTQLQSYETQLDTRTLDQGTRDVMASKVVRLLQYILLNLILAERRPSGRQYTGGRDATSNSRFPPEFNTSSQKGNNSLEHSIDKIATGLDSENGVQMIRRVFHQVLDREFRTLPWYKSKDSRDVQIESVLDRVVKEDVLRSVVDDYRAMFPKTNATHYSSSNLKQQTQARYPTFTPPLSRSPAQSIMTLVASAAGGGGAGGGATERSNRKGSSAKRSRSEAKVKR